MMVKLAVVLTAKVVVLAEETTMSFPIVRDPALQSLVLRIKMVVRIVRVIGVDKKSPPTMVNSILALIVNVRGASGFN